LKNLDTWSIYILTSHEKFEECFGRKATKKRKLFNGFIKTDYYQYWGKRRPRKQTTES
ncbi:class I SAM-dependent RNA methyltransferase, partial [Bacillus altitudinis]|nr:class I SAM-dependent RNA methyltransferase [Bacillus altitudinis]